MAKDKSTVEKADELVDQETGEVKKGQPGATGSTADRPTLTEAEAREVNGYAGHKNIRSQIEEAKGADKSVKADDETATGAKKF